MGCGLRKLEDPDDNSPGKIFSTLKRPQVETKIDSAYEYTLLDFTLEASTNPNVIRIKSLLDIPGKLEEYYIRGYTTAAIHPIMLSTGRRRHLPISYLYRVVLYRLKLSQKRAASPGQRRAGLVIEEWNSLCETLTNESMKTLLEKVNEASRKGMKFIGFVTRHPNQSTNTSVEQESSRHITDDNYKNWTEGTLSGQSSESGIDEEIHLGNESFQDPFFSREGSLPKPRKSQGKALYAVFNIVDKDTNYCKYTEGNLSMKVSRKGTAISAMETDWLELTTCHYQQGLSLIDSVVYWDVLKGDQSPKSLEGLFIYEDDSSRIPGSKKRGNDAIIVEQWTVFEMFSKNTHLPMVLWHALEGSISTWKPLGALNNTTVFSLQHSTHFSPAHHITNGMTSSDPVRHLLHAKYGDCVLLLIVSLFSTIHSFTQGVPDVFGGCHQMFGLLLTGIGDVGTLRRYNILCSQRDPGSYGKLQGSEIKTDYGPLLHTLAEFGWLITCIIPTPIIRQNSEGNLTTKQIIFLQRPVMSSSTVQSPERKSVRQLEEKNKVCNQSLERHAASPSTSEIGQSDDFYLSSSKPYWAKDGLGGFSGFSSNDSMLRDLDDGQFDQEDGVTQVTCM